MRSLKNQSQVEKLNQTRKKLEDDVFNLCHGHITSEKSSKYTSKIIANLRQVADDLETKYSCIQNSLTNILQETESRSSLVDDQKGIKTKLEKESLILNSEADKLQELLLKLQATIDKKQSQIDIKEKTKSNLLDRNGGAEMHPIEKDLVKMKEEIVDTEAYCNDSKAKWLQFQQEIINSTRIKSNLQDEVIQSTRKFLIVNEKKKKLDKEIQAMEQNVSVLKRRIEGKDGYIKRLNSLYHEEKNNHEISLKELEAQRAADTDMLSELAKEIETVRDKIEELNIEIAKKNEDIFEADSHLKEWEQKVHSCRGTLDTVGKKRGREGEMEQLRSEVHKLQVKADSIERQTKTLMDAIESSVDKRDVLLEKAASKVIVQREKNPQLIKSMEGRKTEELKLKLKKLQKQEQMFKGQLDQAKEKDNISKKELVKGQAFLKKIKESIVEMEMRERELVEEKNKNLALTVQLQTRGKWYKSIKDKRYRLAIRDEDNGESELIQLQKQNESIKGAISELEQEFPNLQECLRKIETAFV